MLVLVVVLLAQSEVRLYNLMVMWRLLTTVITFLGTILSLQYIEKKNRGNDKGGKNWEIYSSLLQIAGCVSERMEAEGIKYKPRGIVVSKMGGSG